MKYNAILFDLDDTLIDTKKRHFNIFNEFLNMCGEKIDFEEYLDIRKTKNWSNLQIIKNIFPLASIDFTLFWKRKIEDAQYLNYDTEIVNTKLLRRLKIKMDSQFILLSLRSNPHSAEKQFKNFSFSAIFDEHNFLSHSELNPKIESLKFYKKQYPCSIFISDSQEDCNASELARIDFAGVQSGLYNISCKQHFDNVNSFLMKQLEHDY